MPLKHKIALSAMACLMATSVCNTRADVYSDTTNDLFTASAPQFDISSVVVTNNSSKVTFTINVLGNPTSITWDNYAIALVTIVLPENWTGGLDGE